MTSPELLLLSISTLRVVAEVAGYTLLGQGILWVFAGKSRETNVVYRLMQTITGPVTRLVRLITPRLIIDKHIPFVAFFLLFWMWIGLAAAKRYVCLTQGLSCGM